MALEQEALQVLRQNGDKVRLELSNIKLQVYQQRLFTTEPAACVKMLSWFT